jgi:hypothetical protein
MSQQLAEGRAGAPAVSATESATESASGPSLDLARVVDRAPLRTEPFDHIQMENVFPAGLYGDLLAKLPARDKFHQLYHRDALRQDGTSTRLRLYLYPEILWRLPGAERALWGKISQALCSKALEDAFKRKFRAALEDRFQMPAEKVGLYPVPILVRDQPGYRIGIHSDALTKAITVQFYMPGDTAQAHLGTVFHTTRAKDGTDRPLAMQFLPSTGYAFAVRKKESWHSAPTTTEGDGERRSIMLTYYLDQGSSGFKRRTQRLGIFFGRYPRI